LTNKAIDIQDIVNAIRVFAYFTWCIIFDHQCQFDVIYRNCLWKVTAF